MKNILSLSTLAFAAVILPTAIAHAEIPAAIAAPGEALVATLHAQGAQVYECRIDKTGNRVWQFREPIATLFHNGKTVGRHFVGPKWEMTDGTTVAGKAVGRAAGATPMDIPLLKLDAASPREGGLLAGVTTIQRLNTKGGAADGPCETPGEFLSVPYAADYAFYRKH